MYTKYTQKGDFFSSFRNMFKSSCTFRAIRKKEKKRKTCILIKKECSLGASVFIPPWFLSACCYSGTSQDTKQTGAVDMVAQPKPVPLFTFQSTPMTFWLIKIKSKCFFLFCFKSTGFIDQQADVGQETKKKEEKKGVTGQGYIGGGNCHVHHVVLLISLSWLLFCYKKQWSAILWWRCFLIDAWRVLLMTGEGLQDCGKCVFSCACVSVCGCFCVDMWMSCKKGKCVRVSWMSGFTSVPLSLWGQVPSTSVRARPCERPHCSDSVCFSSCLDFQRLWGECAYPWSPEDSGPCSDTWSRWARPALSPESAPSPPARCCHLAGGPPPASRWRAAPGTPHSINTQRPDGMEREKKKWRERRGRKRRQRESGGEKLSGAEKVCEPQPRD